MSEQLKPSGDPIIRRRARLVAAREPDVVETLVYGARENSGVPAHVVVELVRGKRYRELTVSDALWLAAELRRAADAAVARAWDRGTVGVSREQMKT